MKVDRLYILPDRGRNPGLVQVDSIQVFFIHLCYFIFLALKLGSLIMFLIWEDTVSKLCLFPILQLNTLQLIFNVEISFVRRTRVCVCVYVMYVCVSEREREIERRGREGYMLVVDWLC